MFIILKMSLLLNEVQFTNIKMDFLRYEIIVQK